MLGPPPQEAPSVGPPPQEAPSVGLLPPPPLPPQAPRSKAHHLPQCPAQPGLPIPQGLPLADPLDHSPQVPLQPQVPPKPQVRAPPPIAPPQAPASRARADSPPPPRLPRPKPAQPRGPLTPVTSPTPSKPTCSSSLACEACSRPLLPFAQEPRYQRAKQQISGPRCKRCAPSVFSVARAPELIPPMPRPRAPLGQLWRPKNGGLFTAQATWA